ncbi:MAG: 2-methylcitrate dehydratase [Deltaproteobacteria bacterium GWA2_54_12]|nr:MAG: 2-methylcitrate dehydratase [Deltaproteobacteria bacterium GWA2_54_12]
MTEGSKAERLVDYALGLKYGSIPGQTAREAKRRLIDAFACMLGAFQSAPARIAREAAPAVNSGLRSTILGSSQTTTPEAAAFANGVLIRFLDYNDTYLSKEPAHPSDNIAACLAAAEAADCGGKEFLTAIVAAYEIQLRLCDGASLRAKGWDHVAYGAFSSVIAASMLLGLSREETVNAVNIAGTTSPALRQSRAGELSMWKGCAFANTSKDAVFAAILAKGGMTGPSPIFEGEFGFEKVVSGPIELSSNFGGEDGEGFKIDETYIKFYPAEYHSQSAIGAAIDLRAEIDDPLEVESITVKTFQTGYEIIGKGAEKWRPKTRETADHSLPFLVAAAILDGSVSLSTYSERMIDADLLEFTQKIKVEVDPDMDRMYPSAIPNRVEVRLKSGKLITGEMIYPKGHPMNPMTDLEVEEKFKNLGAWAITENKADEILSKIWELEKMADIKELMRLFTI